VPTAQESVNANPAVEMNAPAGGEQKPLVGNDAQAHISGAPPPPPPAGQRILSREERVEYRDQDGNVLNEEQVKALEGKVEFKTRYETRTRIVDADGNEVQEPEDGWPQGVAPPHPDVDGVDSSTKNQQNGKLAADEPLPDARESVEGQKERDEKSAKPASEGNEATAA
jgi:dolichyl-phosphate-mannose-protein mannosyltransferase